MATRDEIRSKVLGAKGTTKIVILGEGMEVEVRQTTVGQMLESVAKSDLRLRMLQLLIETCYVPGTDERIFEEGDLDALSAMPAGSAYRGLVDAANSLMLPAALEVAEGNSPETGLTS